MGEEGEGRVMYGGEGRYGMNTITPAGFMDKQHGAEIYLRG